MAQRNVMWKDSVAGYSLDGLKNTYRLQHSLKDGSYKISPYQRFMVHEPKEREIVATRIKDRQFQRSLCDNYLYEAMTHGFIYDNCACQRKKGITFAIDRMKHHLRSYYRKHGSDGYYLKCDIHHYFQETRHDVAKAAVRKRVDDDDVYKYVCDIIDSFGGDRGIGLGSQVSQLIELAVLDDLDHRIKEKLHIKYYIRYMDDFVLIDESKEHLKECLDDIRAKLAELGFELNGKTQIAPLRHGIQFLKWRFILSDSGKVILRMDKKKISHERRKLKRMARLVMIGKIPEEYFDDSFRCWKANAAKGNMWEQVRNMEDLYRDLKEVIFHGKTDCNLGVRATDESDGKSRSGCDKMRETGRIA